jgi:hypothetical protein
LSVRRSWGEEKDSDTGTEQTKEIKLRRGV